MQYFNVSDIASVLLRMMKKIALMRIKILIDIHFSFFKVEKGRSPIKKFLLCTFFAIMYVIKKLCYCNKLCNICEKSLQYIRGKLNV